MLEPLSIAEAGQQIRSGALTPIELVERCLKQIDRYDEQVRAWVLVDEKGARRTAEELTKEAAAGNFRGPLHGIPLGIKDIIDIAGFPTRAGSPLREKHMAWADAPLVAALRSAGAILLGKTVTVEFACFDPPSTRNPWDPLLKHTPGGSSSGSAAAVAMGMCLGALGTQTGGSLVRPASYCGIAACKPSFGWISMRRREGIVPVSFHLDHAGPMARTAADLETILRCLVDRVVWEPATLSAPPRLGLLDEFFMERADQAVRDAAEAALKLLRDAGAQIEAVPLPVDFAEVAPMHRRIMAVDAAAYHREQFAAHRNGYGPKIAALLDEGLATSGVDYADALAHKRAFYRQVAPLLKGVDALIMPATETTAPATLETTGSPLFQAPWSYAGVPVVSIPCGLASDGMPVALQLVGEGFRETPLLQRGPCLLRIAQWCEQRLGFSARPPLWQA